MSINRGYETRTLTHEGTWTSDTNESIEIYRDFQDRTYTFLRDNERSTLVIHDAASDPDMDGIALFLYTRNAHDVE